MKMSDCRTAAPCELTFLKLIEIGQFLPGKAYELRLNGDGHASSRPNRFPDVLGQGDHIVRRRAALVEQHQRLSLIHLRAADAMPLEATDFDQKSRGNLDSICHGETLPHLFQSRQLTWRKVALDLLVQRLVLGIEEQQILEE